MTRTIFRENYYFPNIFANQHFFFLVLQALNSLCYLFLISFNFFLFFFFNFILIYFIFCQAQPKSQLSWAEVAVLWPIPTTRQPPATRHPSGFQWSHIFNVLGYFSLTEYSKPLSYKWLALPVRRGFCSPPSPNPTPLGEIIILRKSARITLF